MSKTEIYWALEPHLCRGCGGRVLRCVKGQGMTPGGNPVYLCADCGKSTSGMGPDVLCWCGFSHRGQHATAYRCLPFTAVAERPELERAFKACGFDPSRGEVGIVLESDYRAAIAKASA